MEEDFEGRLGSEGDVRRPLAGVPDEVRFERMLAEAADAPGLRDLRKLVAAWQAVAKQCDVAAAEAMRLAIYRLEVERALGRELSETVGRGGLGSKSHGATSIRGGASRGLPDGITKHDSRRYRALADIPDEVFSSYLQAAREDRKPPSSAGAQRYASRDWVPPAKRTQSVRGMTGAVALPQDVLDAVSTIIFPDTLIGEARMQAKVRVHRGTRRALGVLSGDVFIAWCHDPAGWLPDLVRRRREAQLHQVIVAMPAEVWAPWFQVLARDQWACCLLAGVRAGQGGVALGYLGSKSSAFRAAMSSVGVVCW